MSVFLDTSVLLAELIDSGPRSAPARAASAVVVTDTRRHFMSAPRYAMRVETPAEFLNRLKGTR